MIEFIILKKQPVTRTVLETARDEKLLHPGGQIQRMCWEREKKINSSPILFKFKNIFCFSKRLLGASLREAT